MGMEKEVLENLLGEIRWDSIKIRNRDFTTTEIKELLGCAKESEKWSKNFDTIRNYLLITQPFDLEDPEKLEKVIPMTGILPKNIYLNFRNRVFLNRLVKEVRNFGYELLGNLEEGYNIRVLVPKGYPLDCNLKCYNPGVLRNSSYVLVDSGSEEITSFDSLIIPFSNIKRAWIKDLSYWEDGVRQVKQYYKFSLIGDLEEIEKTREEAWLWRSH